MNGAESLLRTLAGAGVDTCFANPGTSEMHFVAALETAPRMRGILCLFEGVATGAADGYGRIAGKPAATLLHLGPGLANGWANLHNARRAKAPMLNVVGDHATWHRDLDAPLSSDVMALSMTVCDATFMAEASLDVASVAQQAVSATQEKNGQVVSLILPADAAWDPAMEVAEPAMPAAPEPAEEALIARAIDDLKKAEKPALLVNGAALTPAGLQLCARLAAATKAEVLTDTFTGRMTRGAGHFPVTRLPYFAELTVEMLEKFDALVIVGTKGPVSFFAYPEQESILTPGDIVPVTVCGEQQDVLGALEAIAEGLGAPAYETIAGDKEQALSLPDLGAGALTTDAVGRAFARFLPEGAIVSDEALTSGLEAAIYSTASPAHEVLSVTGGAIGQGLPVAIGAAVAAPSRKVIALQADGSAMYTLQSLWTMAREQLDVTVVLLANRAYNILNFELQRVGVQAIPNQLPSLFDLSDPTLDWVSLAKGMGVAAQRCETAEDFNKAFEAAMGAKGPQLIEAVL